MFTIVNLVMFGVGILALMLLFKIFSWNLKVLWKLVVNALVGAVALLILNFLGSIIGFTIPINAISSLIVGILGVPGVILLAIWYFIF